MFSRVRAPFCDTMTRFVTGNDQLTTNMQEARKGYRFKNTGGAAGRTTHRTGGQTGPSRPERRDMGDTTPWHGFPWHGHGRWITHHTVTNLTRVTAHRSPQGPHTVRHHRDFVEGVVYLSYARSKTVRPGSARHTATGQGALGRGLSFLVNIPWKCEAQRRRMRATLPSRPRTGTRAA